MAGRLVNDETADFERRIDLVLARSASPGQIVANRVEVTGDELSDRDSASSGLPTTRAWSPSCGSVEGHA